MYEFFSYKSTITFRGRTLDEVVKLLKSFTGFYRHKTANQFMIEQLEKITKKHPEVNVPVHVDVRYFLRVLCKFRYLRFVKK